VEKRPTFGVDSLDVFHLSKLDWNVVAGAVAGSRRIREVTMDMGRKDRETFN
jgi:hypothetical protein